MKAVSEPPTGRSQHAELTLDQIVALQPGLGQLMPQVADRYWISYYAARAGNWPLAAYQLRELVGLLRRGALTRPKYRADLLAFEGSQMDALLRAVAAEDITAFERAFREGSEVANAYHRSTGHPEIVWRLPMRPPEHLDLTPPLPRSDPGG